MTSGEVCGFVDAYEPKDQAAQALVQEARSRWDEQNKNKKNSSKIGDVPYLKYGCDDITAVVALFQFNEEAWVLLKKLSLSYFFLYLLPNLDKMNR